MDWALDNLNQLLVGVLGTGLAGAAGIFIRLWVKQSVRLYQDDLIRAQNTIKELRETIDLQEERSTVRTALTEDLLAEVDRLKAKASYWEQTDTTSPKTTSRSRSSAKRSRSEPS